ncbi:MAG TPA: GAF domain-containing protein [Methylomirabilota bacterium]|nr:GAF domain-containing protein [Methylomirabilota bacterium]
MKIGRLFPDLLATLGRGGSSEAGLAHTLKQLVALSGARAGGLRFRPDAGAPVDVVVGARRGSSLDRWIRARLDAPARGVRLAKLPMPPPGLRRRDTMLLTGGLGDPAHPAGAFVLLGPAGPRGLGRETIPPSFPRELGHALAHVWRLQQRTRRLEVVNEVTALTASILPIDRIYEKAAEAVGRLIRFDALGVTLLDRERGEFRVLDVAARTALPEVFDVPMPAAGTLTAWVASQRAPRRVDDVTADPSIPEMSRALLSRRGFRSVALAPLLSQGEVIGTLNVTHREPGAFTDADVEILMEVARPLASAVEHARLHAETARRAEELAALNRTTQLITARLDLPSVLEAISRSVTALMGSTGCGIGLLGADRTVIEHAAAHGFRTPEWRDLSVRVGEGIIGLAVSSGRAVRSDDLRADPRSAQRDVDEKEGIRSLLSVPLRVGGQIIGVISAFSTEPGVFGDRHQLLLESFADQAGIAIQNARLFEETRRRERETEALLRAGHAVNQSLDVNETVQLILHQAREVLEVQSCGLFTLDAATGELVATASLDLPREDLHAIRLRVGEGITGVAVKERRPVQTADLYRDPRVRYPQAALRSMLAAPLIVADQTIGALTVLRTDIHHFSAEEESLVSAFADQAAMALEHARLFSSVRTYSERLEAMVAARTHELDEQKRFVEVVLETLPLGLFVLDAELRVISANREGAALLPGDTAARRPFVDLMPAARAAAVRSFLQGVVRAGEVRHAEEELPAWGETLTVRLTATPLRALEASHVLVLVEDITRQKRLERQMVLTERLTTAGRLAAGVAHELNNPLATIAGCAEALKERSQDRDLRDLDAFKDFPGYLTLIEEEAYRCKEITGSLLHFVRDPGSRRAATDLNVLVDKVLELIGHQSRYAQSRLERRLDAELPDVVANEGQLRQVFLGLASNALDAMDGRGTLTVTTRRRNAREIEIAFTDEGPGIPDDILPRVFDPFFTTKPPGQGTGLGLAIAQGIVADHDGRFEVDSRVGVGTTFRVILPVRPGEAAGSGP